MYNIPLPSQLQLNRVGILAERFNYFVSSQRNSQWCWAAALQMIYNYYGVSISQEQIVHRSYGNDPATNSLPDLPASFDLVTKNINGKWYDSSGKIYFANATLFYGRPNPYNLIAELSNQRPILIGYKTGINLRHAVVLTACSYVSTIWGPQIQTLTVRDPDNTGADNSNPGRIEYTGSSLAELIDVHWYIKVAR